jgi:hypothetical protein
MAKYEVTVPLVITINGGEVTDWRLDPGYGGFFSEAEEAGGVWDPEHDDWGVDEGVSDDDNDEIRKGAWRWVKERLP